MAINPINDYINQVSTYLSIETGDDIAQCISFVKDTLKNDSSVVNPTVTYLDRADNGDSTVQKVSLSGYIDLVNERNNIVVPSLTSYLPETSKQSELVGLLSTNIAKRSSSKTKAMQFRAEGKMDDYNYFNTMQLAKKLSNNSLSGTFASKYTVLYNPSAHYTLTSITRSVTSISNSITEKMLIDNRHYSSPDIVLADILSLLHNVDRNVFKSTLSEYNIYIPKVSDVMDVIVKSTNKYWSSKIELARIESLVSKIDPIERAMIVYVNDFYNLRKYNPDFTRNFLKAVSTKALGDDSDIYMPGDMEGFNDHVVSLAHHICYNEIKGMGVNRSKFMEHGVLGTLVKTCKNINNELTKYDNLLAVMFRTKHAPTDIATIQSMLREVTVLSDTDSTCATYQEWVSWYFGDMVFSPEAIALSASVMIINTMTVSHNLDEFSRRMNVSDKNIGVLAMKNEFFWDIVAIMNIAKHYFGNIMIQEGNVLGSMELELKGSNILSTQKMDIISKEAKKIIIDIIKTVTNNEKLSINALIKRILGIEKMILDTIDNNPSAVFVTANIKDKSAYKQDERTSRYSHYLLWKEVFGEKYGVGQPPPYSGIKIPLTLNNEAAIIKWIDAITDPLIKNNASKFIAANNKRALNIIILSREQVVSNGIPDEITMVINKNKLVLESCKVFYLLLEALGYYKKDNVTLTEMFN